jgi:hypothetical protein
MRDPAVLRRLVDVLKLAELWLCNCVPTVELDGPKPLPVIAAAIADLDAALALSVDPPDETPILFAEVPIGAQWLHICQQPGYDASLHRCLGCLKDPLAED